MVGSHRSCTRLLQLLVAFAARAMAIVYLVILTSNHEPDGNDTSNAYPSMLTRLTVLLAAHQSYCRCLSIRVSWCCWLLIKAVCCRGLSISCRCSCYTCAVACSSKLLPLSLHLLVLLPASPAHLTGCCRCLSVSWCCQGAAACSSKLDGRCLSISWCCCLLI